MADHAKLDTTTTTESGGPELVRELGDLAGRIVKNQAAVRAAVLAVGAGVATVLVVLGIVTREDADNALSVVGTVVAGVTTVLAVVVPLVQGNAGAATITAQAETVRDQVVPVSRVAAYAPAAPDQDIAAGPAHGVLDAWDPEQP